MKKLGRNDSCPRGGGKKYKQCCLRAEETRVASDRSEAVPRALQGLIETRGPAVREALDNGFFGGLDDEEYEMLHDQHRDSFEGIMVNAMAWLVADGTITVKGQARRVAELLLDRDGPLFSAQQRQWVLLTVPPLRLYEVIDVVPGECLSLKDVMLPECPPVLVREKAESQQAVKFDLFAARILSVEGHFELSGAVYPFPRNRSWDVIAELRDELDGVEPDSPLAKEVMSVIIPYHWLRLFVTAFELPQLVDHVTGEPILLMGYDNDSFIFWAIRPRPSCPEVVDQFWRPLFQSDSKVTPAQPPTPFKSLDQQPSISRFGSKKLDNGITTHCLPRKISSTRNGIPLWGHR